MPQLKEAIRKAVNRLVKNERPVIEGAERLKAVQEAAKKTSEEIKREKGE